MSRLKNHNIQVALVAALCGLVACGKPPAKARDAPYVEVLRLKITKVRHATDETRETIARSRGAPYLPELYLRLAELLSEEARYHYRVAAEREQQSKDALHVPQVRVLKEQAIGIYESILDRFPDAPIAPQVLFNIGHEHRELGNFDKMREAFEKLAATYLTSRYRYDALLVLGDYHFDRAEFKEARRFYDTIAKGAMSHIAPLAHYRVAWVWVNVGDCKKALPAFEAAIDSARKEHDAGSEVATVQQGSAGVDVRRAALVDLAYCYSQERKAKDAVSYIRKRSHDRATYVAALSAMARRFGLIDDAVGSLGVVRELLVLGPANEDRLEDARQLHGSIRAIKNFTAIGSDVRLIVDAYNRYNLRIDVTAKDRAALREEFETYGRDLLTRAQEHMGKRGKVKNKKAFAKELAIGYRVYLETFRDADAYADMVLNTADVLTIAEQSFEAGQRFLLAAGLLDAPKDKQDALYHAVVAFQEGLDKTSTRADHPDRVIARGAMRNAGTELLRYPVPKDQQRRVKFAIALTYYDEGLYQEAIDRLAAVAYEFPATGESKAAIRLVLDSHNTLNDFQGLIQAGERFLAAGSPADEGLKAEIRPIVAAAEQRMIDELSLEAAGVEGVDLNILIGFARKNKGTALGERALLNAFVAARAVGETDQLYKLGNEISSLYPNSEQLPGMMSTLGQAAVARFEFDRAVKFLRKTASAKHPQRVQLLVAAGELQEDLGDFKGAKDRYNEAIEGSDVRARASAVEHLARLLEKRADPATVVSSLSGYESDNNPEVLAPLGLAKLATGDKDGAEQTLGMVLAAGASASAEATARAHYGMAELLLDTLDEYPELEGPELIEEYVTIVDVCKQSYLNAARQGSASYTPMAFSRLVLLSAKSSLRVQGARVGEGFAAEEVKAIENALKVRTKQLKQTAKEALAACSGLAWNIRSFTPTVRACMDGAYSKSILAKFDSVKGRSRKSNPTGVGELRERLSRNPEDLKSLQQLGIAFLDGGDPHAARLVFMAAATKGGGSVEANLLGIASYRAGNMTGALEAFAEAAEAGLEAGRQNLVTVLEELGLAQGAKHALKQYKAGRAGGRLLVERVGKIGGK